MVSRCPLLGLILTNLFRNRPHIYFSPSHWEALTSVLQSYWQGWSLCSTAIHPGDSFYSLCFTSSRFMRTSLLSFSPSSSFSIFQTFFFLSPNSPPTSLSVPSAPSRLLPSPTCILLYIPSRKGPISPPCLAWSYTIVLIIYFFCVPWLCHPLCLQPRGLLSVTGP